MRYWPLAAVLVCYWAAVALLVSVSLRLNHGRFVYPLDDPYIHMAMAKNLVRHGVWGVTRYEFTSSTSSPLWTALLAVAYVVAGTRESLPLALNLLAGTALVTWIGFLLRKLGGSDWAMLVMAAAIVFLSALPVLTFSGMEHTLHALLTVWFAWKAAAVLAGGSSSASRDMLMLAPLVTSARYEGVFLVAVVAAFLWARHHARVALAVVVTALVPLALYGLWSIGHGWYVVPNSVLLKGQLVAPWTAVAALFANLHIFVLVVAALGMLWFAKAQPRWTEREYLLAIFVATTMLHLEFARTGWLYRYEGYLLVLGLTALGAKVAPLVRLRAIRSASVGRLAVATVLVLAVCLPLGRRGLNALRIAPRASNNIFEQHFQMARFLDAYYDGRTIAVNDIGAISYFTDIKLLDLFGLGSMETAALKRAGRFGTREIAELARRHDAPLAISYDSWLADQGGPPAEWIRLAEWGVRDNVILGQTYVSFYATSASEKDALTAHLKDFAPQLPLDVLQRGAYLD